MGLKKNPCRKIQYYSVKQARKALKRLRRRGVQYFYRCRYCTIKVYHLTSQDKERKHGPKPKPNTK